MDRLKHSMAPAAAAVLALITAYAVLIPAAAPAVQPAADEYQLENPGLGVQTTPDRGRLESVRSGADREGIAGETLPVDSPVGVLRSATWPTLALLVAVATSLAWVVANRRNLARAG